MAIPMMRPKERAAKRWIILTKHLFGIDSDKAHKAGKAHALSRLEVVAYRVWSAVQTLACPLTEWMNPRSYSTPRWCAYRH